MPDAAAPPDSSAEQADVTIRSKAYVGLLVMVAVIGVVVSIATWCLLEAIFQIQQELYVHLPHVLGYRTGRRNGGRFRSWASAGCWSRRDQALPG